MKSALLILLVFTIAALKTFTPESEPPLTRAAIMEAELDRVESLFSGLNFDCAKGRPDYEAACELIGVALKWSDRDDKLWGQVDRLRMELFLPRCDEHTASVFFHEIGHHAMGHTGLPGMFTSEDITEPEADAFSAGMMDRLSLPISDPRVIHYSSRAK